MAHARQLMKNSSNLTSFVCAMMLLLGRTALAANPFIGEWALTIPSGAAGWLGVVEKDGKLSASILWGGGSVLPVEGVKLDGDTLVLTRLHQNRGRDAAGKNAVMSVTTEIITAKAEGDTLKLTTVQKRPNGQESAKDE